MVSYLGVVRTVMMADTAQFNRAVSGASVQFHAAATKMRTDAQSLVSIGGALNLAITLPAMFAARAIVKAGSAYETEMMKIRNATDMTDKAMKTFLATQKRIAKTTNTSRTSLAQIGYIAAQGQISSPKAIAAFQKSVSKAQHIMPGDASDVVVAEGFRSIINAFKLSANEFEPTMARLIKTINLGSISWQEYAKTISFVTSIAAATKTPEALQNMNMALAVLTHGGGQTGQRAARSLRGLYSSIYKTPTKASSALASSLGYSGLPDMFERGAGSDLLRFMKMFPAWMRNMGGMSKMGFTRESVTSALALANASEKIIEDFKARYARAPEDFDKQFEASKQNPAFDLKAFSNAWEDLKLAFFEAIGPSLIEGLQALTAALRDMTDSPAKLKQLAAGLIALLSAISIGMLGTGIGKTINLTRRLRKLIGRKAQATPIEVIDPSINAGKISAARLVQAELAAKTAAVKLAQAELASKMTAAKLAETEAGAAIAESKLRQTLRKEREFAERAISKAKQAEAAAAAKQATNAAKTAVASEFTQAATQQAEAAILGARRGQLAALSLGNAANVKGLLGYGAGIGLPPAPGPFSPLMPGYSGPLKRGLPNINRPPKMLNRRRLLGYSGMVPYASRALSNRTDAGLSRYTRIPFGNTSGAGGVIDMEMGANGVFQKKRNLIGGSQGLAMVPFAGRAVKPPRIPGTGFFGKDRDFAKISKSIFVALGGMLKFASTLYIIVSAFRGLGRVLEVTLWPVIQGLLPSGVSLKDAFSALLRVLKQVDAFIVNVFMLAFAGVVGTFENLFGTIIGGVMLVISKIKELWAGLSIWVRDSWVGRKLGIDPSDEELAELQALKDERGKKTDYWAEYMAGQFKGIFGGEQSAVARILADIEEKRKGRGAGDGPTIDETLHDAQVQARDSFQNLVKELSSMLSGGHSIGGAPGLFEAGTQEGYKALIQSNDSLLQVMTTLKDKTERFLSRIDDAGHDTVSTLDAIHEFLKRQPGVTP